MALKRMAAIRTPDYVVWLTFEDLSGEVKELEVDVRRTSTRGVRAFVRDPKSDKDEEVAAVRTDATRKEALTRKTFYLGPGKSPKRGREPGNFSMRVFG